MKRMTPGWKTPLKACLASSLMGVSLHSSAVLADEPLLDLNSVVSAAEPVGVEEQEGDFVDPTRSDGATEVINERYPDGTVKIRREMKQDELGNYIRHGAWQMWDRQGNLVAEGEYKENERHGQWTRWYRGSEAKLFSQSPYKSFEGPYISQATFKEGQLDGKWVVYDTNQRKISEWEFADGVRHGKATWWHPKGHTLEEITYRDGLIDGHLRVWNGEGVLVTEEEYQQGRKLALKTDKYPNGAKKSEGMYLHAQYALKTPDDWWNAQPATYVTQGQDVRHGVFTSWYENGQKEFEGEFKNDLRVGEFSYWYSNGQKRLQGAYADGKPNGAWVWWHKNGQKSTQGQYVQGDPRGPWAYWKEDGQLHQKADYSAKPDSSVVKSDSQPEEDAASLPPLRSVVR